MIARSGRARQWRAALLALLLAFFGLLLALATLDEKPPFDRLPLRGVPESEYARAGISVVPAYKEQAAMAVSGAKLLAKQSCCGQIKQIVLVRLKEEKSTSLGLLTYAVNWDTSMAPDYPCLGGANCPRIWFFRDMDYFVAFFDASSGAHIYSFFPGSEYPFPEPEDQESLALYGVPPEQLAVNDIVLRKPPAGADPIASEDNARNYVTRRFPGAVVRQVVLGQLTHSTGEFPPIYEELVWVVNLERDSLSVPAVARDALHSSAPQFALVFLDANTTEFVYFLSR